MISSSKTHATRGGTSDMPSGSCRPGRHTMSRVPGWQRTRRTEILIWASAGHGQVAPERRLGHSRQRRRTYGTSAQNGPPHRGRRRAVACYGAALSDQRIDLPGGSSRGVVRWYRGDRRRGMLEPSVASVLSSAGVTYVVRASDAKIADHALAKVAYARHFGDAEPRVLQDQDIHSAMRASARSTYRESPGRRSVRERLS